MDRSFNIGIDFTKDYFDFDLYFNPEDNLLYFFPGI